MATNWSEGTPWGNKKDPANWDIVDKELNRYQPAFEHVQRYTEGYGGQPTKPTGGSTGGSTGGGFGGGGPDWDRLIGAIEKGVQGWGSNASASTAPVSNTNTFNPVFNPTISMTGPNTQVAGGDIRESPISTETVTTGGGIIDKTMFQGFNDLKKILSGLAMPVDPTGDRINPAARWVQDTAAKMIIPYGGMLRLSRKGFDNQVRSIPASNPLNETFNRIKNQVTGYSEELPNRL